MSNIIIYYYKIYIEITGIIQIVYTVISIMIVLSYQISGAGAVSEFWSRGCEMSREAPCRGVPNFTGG